MEQTENNSQNSTHEETEIKIPGVEEFDRAEWLFQFDEEDPVVIAWSNSKDDPGELSFIFKANNESNLIFRSQDGSKVLKIFARRMSEERRLELDEIERKERELIEKINGSLEE